MLFGLLAIICWLFLLGVILGLPITVIRRNRLGTVVVSAFLLGGLGGYSDLARDSS